MPLYASVDVKFVYGEEDANKDDWYTSSSQDWWTWKSRWRLGKVEPSMNGGLKRGTLEQPKLKCHKMAD
jgi:hypothetical protein